MARSVNDEISDNVAPIRRIQPGELLDVVQKLRSLMMNYAAAGFTLYAAFGDIGDPKVEVEAQKTRHSLELAAGRISSLLAAIEETPHYKDMRQAILEKRKSRRMEEEIDG